MLEDEIEKVWTESHLPNVSTRTRQGWRDFLIATGPAPQTVRSSDIDNTKEHAGYFSRREINSIKYSCCKKICGIIEKDIELGILSPNNYIRQFAEQILKNRRSL